jgi:gliding motility-associated-like protein
MKLSRLIFLRAFSCLLLLWPFLAGAQLTATGSVYRENTNYPVFSEIDPVFVFCGNGENAEAKLLAQTSLSGSKSWEWQKFNPLNGAFEFYFSENNSNNSSEISTPEDGCYRIRITTEQGNETFRAWVFNNRHNASAAIAGSGCSSFTLESTFDSGTLVYYDLSSQAPVLLNRELQVEWRKDEEVVARTASVLIVDPPSKETVYTMVLSDRFGCETTRTVTYQSLVTKASFTVDPANGEAPLEVKFTNTSENGDPGSYEWFFFRDLDEIKNDPSVPVDSILLVAYDDNPVYVFENSGTYMVKLVSKKRTGELTCTDTVYLDNYIVADTSFIAIPNIFTPNGDGTNDNFVVKFWSMKEVKISVFNRWGRTVHVWQSGNVQGFEKTWAETVWDGRIGGRYASPGVYFYVVEGFGRDGKKRWKHGNVYLMREKE